MKGYRLGSEQNFCCLLMLLKDVEGSSEPDLRKAGTAVEVQMTRI
jgi:hypothetical protein